MVKGSVGGLGQAQVQKKCVKNMKVAQLRSSLRSLGLPDDGRKAELLGLWTLL